MSEKIDMMAIINDISYPRLAGTENDEVKCKAYLENKFKELNVDTMIDKVEWSEFSTNVLLRLIVSVIFVGLLV